MQQALQNSQPSGLQRIAQLLSGHQIAAAAVLAASIGDVRLASLIAQVTSVDRHMPNAFQSLKPHACDSDS